VCVQENGTNGKQQFPLFAANGKTKTSIYLLQTEMEMDVFFPWSANDKRNRRLLFQQMCPSMPEKQQSFSIFRLAVRRSPWCAHCHRHCISQGIFNTQFFHSKSELNSIEVICQYEVMNFTFCI
jgi:hypothetical protein